MTCTWSVDSEYGVGFLSQEYDFVSISGTDISLMGVFTSAMGIRMMYKTSAGLIIV